MNKLISRSYRQLRRGGLKTFLLKGYCIFQDYIFDKKYGLDTLGWEKVTILPSEEDRENSSPYQATRARPLRILLKKLDLDKRLTFIDIGSGKGKVLLVAYDYGFNNIIGIELSEYLCKIARDNINKYIKNDSNNQCFKVSTVNILDFDFNLSDCVLFMFNPFDEDVISQMIDKIIKEYNLNSSLTIIYRNPKYKEPFKLIPNLKSQTYEIYGDEYEVFFN